MVLPVYQSERRAKGTASGSDSRMVSGWTTLSNWDARIMYMKITARRKTQRNSANVRSNSRARPDTTVV
jgi:hypothetical protein